MKEHVPANRSLFNGTIPANYFLSARMVSADNLFHMVSTSFLASQCQVFRQLKKDLQTLMPEIYRDDFEYTEHLNKILLRDLFEI